MTNDSKFHDRHYPSAKEVFESTPESIELANKLRSGWQAMTEEERIIATQKILKWGKEQQAARDQQLKTDVKKRQSQQE